MQGLTFRQAATTDLDRVFAILYDRPPREAVAVAGDIERARKIGRIIVRAGAAVRLDRTVLADAHGEAVGLIETVVRGQPLTSGAVVMMARVLVGGALIVGLPGAVRFFRWRAARSRVEVPHPLGSSYIAELAVHATWRNRGIGGSLLAHAEERARVYGHKQMSLNTATDNPAQHLYQRHGFRIVETRLDATYERLTGIPGRVLMVKELA
jgi:ribosomal protein S18 acetylase RimI-like enzyme